MRNRRLLPGICAAASCLLLHCARYDAQPSYLGLALLVGSPAETTATAAAARNGYRIFLTAATVDGNLGGISGADSVCNSDANRPSTQWTYKALLVDGTNRRACTTANCPGGAGEHIGWIIYANKQ